MLLASKGISFLKSIPEDEDFKKEKFWVIMRKENLL